MLLLDHPLSFGDPDPKCSILAVVELRRSCNMREGSVV